MEISIKHKGKILKLEAGECGVFKKGIGLMFRSKNTENLLFPFSSDVRISIHSFFVFFPFLAVWLDGENRVMELKIVRPFTMVIRPKKKFRKLVELPLNNKNTRIVDFLVGKERFKYSGD